MMKVKALLLSVVFIGAIFSGSALAGEKGQMPSGMHKADEIIGKTVVSQQGQELGSIENLVISQNGQVEYIILSRGGVAGMGENMVPVPWQAANLQQQQDKLTASITQEQLQNAPTFDGDNWAQISSPQYEQEVHSFFGTESEQTDELERGLEEERDSTMPATDIPARE